MLASNSPEAAEAAAVEAAAAAVEAVLPGAVAAVEPLPVAVVAAEPVAAVEVVRRRMWLRWVRLRLLPVVGRLPLVLGWRTFRSA